jgi:predicted ATPase
VREDLPTGTVTFLFTDVEGSTRLLHELGAEAYAQALAEHRRVVREACVSRTGVEVDTQGDAFFFAFPSAPGAVAAGQAIVDALASGRVRVRIGLHTGTPFVSEEGYVGEDVHVAARVAACGHGGQVLLSQRTRELVDGLTLADLGEHRLKDIEGAVSIYQLGEERFPPLGTISNTNLPRPASSFVGREREREELVGLLRNGTRLVTVSGPGGSGKTRLSVEVASELVADFKAGVFWVGLSALRDPALVTETITQTLGARDSLAKHIGERELLLLLDNFEQVVDAAPELARLLEACPSLKLLVTSREPLRINGEIEYPLPPLTAEEGVELFCVRARLEANEAIAKLCRRLDDLPLALELAAARTRVLTPAQILERLGERLELFRGGRDANPRQRTLRATIAWSHDLLTPYEQALFMRLAVFAGGCALEAAEEVAHADVETIQALVEKSLVHSAEGRFEMLETIREYALERLRESGEDDNLRRTLSRLLLRFGEAALGATGGEREARLAGLHQELDNMREAMEWALRADVELALRLAAIVPLFGPFPDEERRWLDEAIAKAATVEVTPALRAPALQTAAHVASSWGDHGRARPLYEEALELYRAFDDSTGEARALAGLGLIASQEGEPLKSRELYEQSLALYGTLRDQDGEWIVLNNLGELAREEGDHERATEFLTQAVAVGQSCHDSENVAMSLHGLGDVALELGDVEAALRRYRESFALVVAVKGRHRNICYCLAAMASASAAAGDARGAGRFWGALEAFEEELGIRLHQEARSRYEQWLTGVDKAMFAHGVGEGRKLPLDALLALPT